MQLKEVNELFSKEFGGGATHLFTAAGRINVIGEHVDYCGGKVLPAALNLRCNIYGRKNGLDSIRILLRGIEGVIEIDMKKLDAYKDLKYGNYQAGVAYYLAEKGVQLVGCDLFYDCTVPFGSGLFYFLVCHSKKDMGNGAPHDTQIIKRAGLFQIFQIEDHLGRKNGFNINPVRVFCLFEQFRLVAKTDAGQTGQARRQQQCGHHLIGIMLHITGHLGAGSHKTHLPQKDIKQLRNLIQPQCSQFFAHFCDPGVISAGHLGAQFFRIGHHGAEFEDPKTFP